MLRILDKDKVPVKGLQSYKDLCVQKVLDLDEKTLTFTAPLSEVRDIIVPEGYIETKEDRFVIKEVVPSTKGTMKITAKLDVEALEGSVFRSFQSSTQTIESCLRLAFAGTGWTVASSEITKQRTISMTNVSAWEILEQALSTYTAEVEIDSKNQTVSIYEKRGEDRGAYLSSQLNLKSLEVTSDSYDFYTELEAYGKDGLTFADINGGNNYVTNYQYSTKRKRYLWKDERYTIAEHLLEDAISKLDDMSKPYTSYSADVIDLARASGGVYSILAFGIGDTVTVIDGITGTKEKQRIVGLKQYPEEPTRDTCTLSNVALTFDEAASKYESAADTVDNITNDNGTVDGDTIDGIYSDQIYDLDTAVIGEAVITDLIAQYVEVTGELTAVRATIGELEANVATIDQALIGKLDADEAYITFAQITDLDATYAQIEVLEASYANIESLLAGNAGIGDLQTIHLTVDNTVIDSALIREAVIQNITANDILAGRINTSEIIISSDSGGLVIEDNTMQFTDADGTVRIQIGQDAEGNFTFILYDETGEGILIDSEGIKASAIADGLIVNDMVADDAAISGSKLDIVSLYEAMNGSTEVLYSSRIWFDEENQSLNQIYTQMSETITTVQEDFGVLETSVNTSLSNLSDTVSGVVDDVNTAVETVTTMQTTVASIVTSIDGIQVNLSDLTTEISGYGERISASETSLDVLQGYISAIISESELTEVSSTNTMYSKLAALILEVDGLLLQFSDLQTSYDTLSGQYTEMNSRLATFEISLDGLSSTVSSVQADFESMYINYCTNGTFEENTDGWAGELSTTATATIYNGKTCAEIYFSESGIFSYGFTLYEDTTLVITFSACATADYISSNILYACFENINNRQEVLLTEDWQEYSFTWDYSAGSTNFSLMSARIDYTFDTQRVYITDVRITTETLADSMTQISAMGSSLTQLINEISLEVVESYVTETVIDGAINDVISQSESLISASIGEIELSVASVETRVTSLESGESLTDSRLDSLETWRTEASLVITDSAIISTVISSSSYENSVASIIEQNAESIRLMASRISWESTYSSMTENGTLTCRNATLYGVFHSDNGTNDIYMSNATLSFIRSSTDVGNIGTNNMTGSTTTRGLEFDLEYTGNYMGWAARLSSSATEYTIRWAYFRSAYSSSSSSVTANTLNAFCNIDMHGYDILNVDLSSVDITNLTSINGYSLLTATGRVVTSITANSSGGISWTYGTVQFRCGLVCSWPS